MSSRRVYRLCFHRYKCPSFSTQDYEYQSISIVSSLQVGTDKKKLKERYVILCDGLLIVCSLPARRSSTSTMAGPASELRYRDKFFIRLINIADREDEEGIKNSFELCPRDQQKVVTCHLLCLSDDIS